MLAGLQRRRRHLLVALGLVALGLVALGLVGCAGAGSDPTAADPGAPTAPRSSPATTASAGLGENALDAPRTAGVLVTRVVDGDTIEVAVGQGTDTVRLIGINSPEGGECFAAQSTAALEALVSGARVGLERDTSDRDRFGRLLRYVYVDDVFVNEALVLDGFAIARRYPPDVAEAERLERAQRRAEDTGRGMWSTEGCVAPGAESTGLVLWVQADAPGDDSRNLNGEWVEIRNTGSDPVGLAGWTVKDESATHRYRIPEGVTVLPRSTLRLFSGCGTDTATELYWCAQGSAIWNNDGDTAFLLDPQGRIVATYRY